MHSFDVVYGRDAENDIKAELPNYLKQTFFAILSVSLILASI